MEPTVVKSTHCSPGSVPSPHMRQFTGIYSSCFRGSYASGFLGYLHSHIHTDIQTHTYT